MDDFFRWQMHVEFGLMSPRRSMAVIRPEGLPEPLQKVAEAMHDAKTDDEARAAASEFLTLSEEWVDDVAPSGESPTVGA